MTPRSVKAATLLVAALAVAGCRSHRTPSAPSRPRPTESLAVQTVDVPTPQECIDAYPIGDATSRVDLLATCPQHSMYLIQTRRPIARHFRPGRTEILIVLSGTGICYTGDKSRPIVPDTAFRFDPGVIHTVIPDDGRTIVALSYLSPPLADGADDRVVVQ